MNASLQTILNDDSRNVISLHPFIRRYQQELAGVALLRAPLHMRVSLCSNFNRNLVWHSQTTTIGRVSRLSTYKVDAVSYRDESRSSGLAEALTDDTRLNFFEILGAWQQLRGALQ